MINDWVENQKEERIAVGGGGEWGGGGYSPGSRLNALVGDSAPPLSPVSQLCARREGKSWR